MMCPSPFATGAAISVRGSIWSTMIALIQRVSEAQVRVADEVVGAIGRGIVALIGVRRGDTEAAVERLLERLLSYRVFPDAEGRMGLSLREVGGGLLLVPQFTLAADTHKGTRAGFSTAAAPEAAQALFARLVARAQESYAPVSAGVFGGHMQVSLVNDGPVTFWLETP
jgi:D-aminoacyl-tRNA deacylase